MKARLRDSTDVFMETRSFRNLAHPLASSTHTWHGEFPFAKPSCLLVGCPRLQKDSGFLLPEVEKRPQPFPPCVHYGGCKVKRGRRASASY